MNKKAKLIDLDRLQGALRKAGIKPKSIEGTPETPVAEAVKTMAIAGENIIGSGFMKNMWIIMFLGKVSDEVGIAQEQTELKLNAGRITTELFLPGIKKSETAKARNVFDLFAYFYLEGLEKKLGIV